MGKSCGNCGYREISAICEPCRSCRLSGISHLNWTPNIEDAKRALNHAYGKWNMGVASMYPKKLEKPIYIGTGPALPINNEIVEYLKNDVEATMEMYLTGGRSNGKTLRTLDEAAKKIGCRVVAESWFKSVNMPGIEKVIFSGPCTIVLWDDNTKTVVRAQGDDVFDPEKGLAMAISKKALGNKGNYFDEFKKWLPEDKEPTAIGKVSLIKFDGTGLKAAIEKAAGNAAASVKAISDINIAMRISNELAKEDDEPWQEKLIEYLEGLKK